MITVDPSSATKVAVDAVLALTQNGLFDSIAAGNELCVSVEEGESMLGGGSGGGDCCYLLVFPEFLLVIKFCKNRFIQRGISS